MALCFDKNERIPNNTFRPLGYLKLRSENLSLLQYYPRQMVSW